MRSQFSEWLDQMQKATDGARVIVQARHYDLLDHYFKTDKTPQEAAEDYVKNFLPRWNAITKNGKHTEALPDENGNIIIPEKDRLLTPRQVDDKFTIEWAEPQMWEYEKCGRAQVFAWGFRQGYEEARKDFKK